MRIAISGTACQGKTTLINDFVKNWPNYKTPEETYRDVIRLDNLTHSSKSNKDTQWKILNFMLDQLQNTSKDDKIIFDRCPLDNIVYSLWSCAKNNSDINDKFIETCIPLVKESLKFLDIIFLVPITKVAPVQIKEDKLRDTDPKYIEEIDAIFKAISHDCMHNPSSTFFDKDDRPAIIDVFGNQRERIEIIKLYLDNDGDLIEPGNIISQEELQEMEKLKKVFGSRD